MLKHLDPNPEKIILLEAIHSVAEETLKERNLKIYTFAQSFSGEDLTQNLKDHQIVGIRSKTKMTREVLNKSSHLSAIGCFCIGTNQVDLIEANQLGIPVFNAPYSNTRSVAELVISEMISLSRKIMDRSQKAHQGVWDKSASGSNEVRGKTLGIVGYGHIGSQVSILAEALGLKVIYYDIIKKLPLGNAVSCNTLNELLSESDFVTLHVPETPETQKMITKKEFGLMKKGSYLLNLSRGTVVVIEDLVEVLKSEHLSGAAIDVYPVEPESNKETFQSELQGLGNVILTPHIGGSTQEAQKAIGYEVSESLLKYIFNGSTTGAVNFPQLEVPTLRVGARILNVHKNQPGVLGAINTLISNTGANISTQLLSTDENIGYLVVDIDNATHAEELAIEISKQNNSIKTRLLRA